MHDYKSETAYYSGVGGELKTRTVKTVCNEDDRARRGDSDDRWSGIRLIGEGMIGQIGMASVGE